MHRISAGGLLIQELPLPPLLDLGLGLERQRRLQCLWDFEGVEFAGGPLNGLQGKKRSTGYKSAIAVQLTRSENLQQIAVPLQAVLRLASSPRWVPMVFVGESKELCNCFWPSLHRLQGGKHGHAKTSLCMPRSLK
jgi:hypothetical protein